ncbi:mannitol dehydrogenase family protein [Alteromonas sp. a30]|uniref:mannitol dehydrogenase family protein n=1 Tax=Alteromonas sp. a30 TaxID=2730917 RepID=UPI00227F4FC0|nr:mannitol dehydrogenase family protein [Alteromonas sp. a30]MCY7297200.1 mannitol dehydrogenase family protein [Alteromonas sp. a30]
MSRLSKNTLSTLPQTVLTPEYDLASTETGIVHLGPGAFHRAHQAVYTDMAMKHGGNWRIDAVSMRSKGLQEKLSEQDNLYSLVVLDEKPYMQVIGAFNHIFVLNEQREQVMASMCAASTHIISSTITEKGYCLNGQGDLDVHHADIKHDLANPESPISAIGLLVAVLRQRQISGADQLTIISCDNLSNNGDKLGKAVLAFANLVEPELALWIQENIAFPNTMVDSITPATDEALIALAQEKMGLTDAWPIQREGFTQWVIEDKFSGPRPAWEKVGVTFTNDVHNYEKAKLRILNGTHSSLAYIGSLAGLDTVYNAISQPALAQFIRRLLLEEIIPSIAGADDMNLPQYAEEISQRYHNRHIRHLLAQIAWDGSQKLPFRILDTVRDNLAAGRSITCLCVPLAAWIRFIAWRHETGVELVDPLSSTLLSLAETHKGDLQQLGNAILNLDAVFADLVDHTEFRETVLTQLNTLTSLNEANLSDCLGDV